MFSEFSSSWKFKLSLSKFLQTDLNNLLFRFLPFNVSRFYVTILGRLYYLVNWQEKALIREAINQVFRGKIGAGELQRKIKAAFKGIFAHYHEKLFVAYSNFPELLNLFRNQIRFQGQEKLQEALHAGNGVILVTGHFGAVELLPGALVVKGFPTSMICRFQTIGLREAQGRRAECLGLELIDADKGESFFLAVKALKKGRILITECDEFEAWRPAPQRQTHFLDHQLSADRTLELLQQRSGAPVITAMVQREGQKNYTCHLTAMDPGADPVHQPISEQCLRVLETSVQNHPEQWYQWKNFGTMINNQHRADHDHKESGYLAPEINLSLPDQA